MNSHAEPSILRLEHVTMVRDMRLILDDINFTVNSGDFVAITGPNGGGKTTLLRIILRLLRPTRGKVYVSENLSIGYLPQKNMIDSHFPITVDEVVSSGLLAEKGLSKAETRKRVEATLEKIEMSHYAQQPIGVLSGGQLQRTLLGRAIISEPKLLVLDEPLSYIDKHFEGRLYRLIEEISERATILLVSHEMSEIAGMADRHLIIDKTLHECSASHHYVRTECDE